MPDPAMRTGSSSSYPLEARRRFVGATVTLDGDRAQIIGRRLDFAVVLTNDGRRGEYAWQTVERVVDQHGGAFTT